MGREMGRERVREGERGRERAGMECAGVEYADLCSRRSPRFRDPYARAVTMAMLRTPEEHHAVGVQASLINARHKLLHSRLQ